MYRKLVIAFSIAALTALATAPANSASRIKKDSGPQSTQTVAMSPDVGEKLLAVQELVEEQKAYAQALADLQKLRDKKKNMSPYEKAQVWNLTAYVHYLQENYAGARQAYENVLAQPELPQALMQSTLKTLSQLYFIAEDYKTALATVKRLIAILPEPSAEVLLLLGQAHYQLGDYRAALGPITEGIELYKAQGRVPKENWLLLLRVIHYEMKDYPKMVVALKQLIRYYPKDQYLLTLAGAYSELGDTKKQLALTEVLYEKGLLDRPSHITNLANLYLMHGLPYKAAKLLETEMASQRVENVEKNYKLLSQAWYQAREDKKAIPPMKRAAELSGDGELYVRLAQSYINLEEWQNAVTAVRNGLNRGGLKRTDTAYLMLGMALMNQKKFEDAKSQFVKARADSRSSAQASQWLKFIDTEIRRRDTLEQVVPTKQPNELDELLKDDLLQEASG